MVQMFFRRRSPDTKIIIYTRLEYSIVNTVEIVEVFVIYTASRIIGRIAHLYGWPMSIDYQLQLRDMFHYVHEGFSPHQYQFLPVPRSVYSRC